MKNPIVLLLAIGLVLSSAVIAQDPPPTPAETPAGPGAGVRPGGTPSTEPQPYEKVITKEAKSKDGVFKVHKVKDKYFYEIPKDQLGKEFLWVTQIAKNDRGRGLRRSGAWP